MNATTRRALFGAAAALPALVTGAPSIGHPASAFEAAWSEHDRLALLGRKASRAAIAAGKSVDEADAADAVFMDPAMAHEDFILEAVPACAKGAAVKLRKLLDYIPATGPHRVCVLSLLAWAEAS